MIYYAFVFVEKSFSDGLYFVNKNGQRKQHLYFNLLCLKFILHSYLFFIFVFVFALIHLFSNEQYKSFSS